MLKTQTLVLEPLRNELNIKDSRAFTILSQESCFPFTVGLSLFTFSPTNITKCLKRSKNMKWVNSPYNADVKNPTVSIFLYN